MIIIAIGLFIIFGQFSKTPILSMGLVIALGALNAYKWYYNVYNGFILGAYAGVSIALMNQYDIKDTLIHLLIGISVGTLQGLGLSLFIRKRISPVEL